MLYVGSGIVIHVDALIEGIGLDRSYKRLVDRRVAQPINAHRGRSLVCGALTAPQLAHVPVRGRAVHGQVAALDEGLLQRLKPLLHAHTV